MEEDSMEGAEDVSSDAGNSVDVAGHNSGESQMMVVEDEVVQKVAELKTGLSSDQQYWRGCSMEEIHRCLNEFELEHLEPVVPSPNHTVLHHYPIKEPDDTPPRPLRSHPKWDSLHVRLPCSPKSQYPVTEPDGSARIESRWEMIEQALLKPITNSHELQAAILSYNLKYKEQWDFRALHKLFKDELDESETRVFFEDLLPRIIRLALRLPELIHSPIPLLKQGQTHSLTLTQQQISCLLANAFLCTFPRRNTLKRKSEYSTFPDINFNRLFQSSGHSVLEKIKCFCHYFRRVCPTERDASNVPTGVVTFTRRCLLPDELPQWGECSAPLGATPLHITSKGTIEDQGLGLLQVDFANKYLGGGVLGGGCVQEEIRFVICPELLISKLFTECLRPTEALIMSGAERYSNYIGYASSFQWDSNHEDYTPFDSSRRRQTHIVAIDALHFQQKAHQYREELMLRELNKAYVGFIHPLLTPAPGIASGNWGCGAFGGDANLKALLQLMVCTVAGRPLVYFTFGNETLRDDVHCMHNFFIEEQIRVMDLWNVLQRFQTHKLSEQHLYDYIYKELKKGVNDVSCDKAKRSTSSSCSSNNKPLFLTKKNVSSGSSNDGNTRSSGVKSKTQRGIKDFFLSTTSSKTTTSSELNLYVKQATTTATAAISHSAIVGSAIAVDDYTAEENAALLAVYEAVTAAEVATEFESPIKAQCTTLNTTELNSSKGGVRQRSLLEVLDQSYAEGVSSKRHCQGKPTNGNKEQ